MNNLFKFNEIFQQYNELSVLFPDIVKPLNHTIFQTAFDYIFEPDFSIPYIWEIICKTNVYGYSVLMHEFSEAEYMNKLISTGIVSSWEEARQQNLDKIAHGRALFEQYKILQLYIKLRFNQFYPLTQICYCDCWDELDYDLYNARRLKNYLKRNETEWYNKNNETFQTPDRILRHLLVEIRGE